MTGPLIHIGYHRTGTSWLQRHVFPNRDLGFVSPFRHAVADRLVLPNALDFNPKECARCFEAELRAAEQQGLVPVVSSERLSGNPHSGGYDSKELADRLLQTFPSARILVVLREQRSMIRSTYARYVRGGGPCSLERYLLPPRRGRGRIPLFDLDHFCYHRLIRYYFSRFGRGRVRVLLYEQLRDRPHEFVAEIVRFAGAAAPPEAFERLPYARRENAGLSALGLGLRRRLNPIAAEGTLNPWVLLPVPGLDRLLWHLARRADALAPHPLKRVLDRRLARRVARVVAGHYAESNRETAELTGLDLASSGYELEAEGTPPHRGA